MDISFQNCHDSTTTKVIKCCQIHIHGIKLDALLAPITDAMSF